VSPASDETLIREVYTDVSEAVDDKKLTLDATGRNSLYKIHVSLGKIVNSLNEKETGKEKGREGRKSSVTPSVLNGEEPEEDEKTVLPKTEEEEDDLTIMEGKGGKGRRETGDSLVEELLSDGDVDMSGM
jgi:condensin complex subunit 3